MAHNDTKHPSSGARILIERAGCGTRLTVGEPGNRTLLVAYAHHDAPADEAVVIATTAWLNDEPISTRNWGPSAVMQCDETLRKLLPWTFRARAAQGATP